MELVKYAREVLLVARVEAKLLSQHSLRLHPSDTRDFALLIEANSEWS